MQRSVAIWSGALHQRQCFHLVRCHHSPLRKTMTQLAQSGFTADRVWVVASQKYRGAWGENTQVDHVWEHLSFYEAGWCGRRRAFFTSTVAQSQKKYTNVRKEESKSTTAYSGPNALMGYLIYYKESCCASPYVTSRMFVPVYTHPNNATCK